MLTPKQYKLLMFIDNSIKENGCCPSFEEMKQAVGIKSKSGIHALIEELIERDFIKKLPHKARALRGSAHSPLQTAGNHRGRKENQAGSAGGGNPNSPLRQNRRRHADRRHCRRKRKHHRSPQHGQPGQILRPDG